jgi:tetratricopeptide (TPR) repeat protein
MLALQDANRAITSDPKSPEGYLLRASVLFDPKVRGAAVGDLRTALRLAPDDPRVRRGLAAAVLSQDGPTTEVKGLVEWVRERARVAEDYRLLARWELKTKHPERALEHAKRGVSADAWCVPCYELAADASLGMRDYDGAVRWQRQAVNVAAEHVTKGSLDRLTHFEKLKKSPLPAPEKPKRDAEADAIHDAIRARRPDFDVCYETGLARDPTLRGKVVVIFVVGADGSVMGANDAGSELRDTGVIECVVGLVRTMKFARPANGARAHRHRWGFPKKAREGAPNTEGAPPP